MNSFHRRAAENADMEEEQGACLVSDLLTKCFLDLMSLGIEMLNQRSLQRKSGKPFRVGRAGLETDDEQLAALF